MKNFDKGTVIRSLVLVVALVNQLLIGFGATPIPGDEAIWYEVLSTIFTIVAAVIAWFKNNYVTLRGQKQKETLEQANLTKKGGK